VVDTKGEFLGFGVITVLTYAQYLPVQVAVPLVVGGRGADGALGATSVSLQRSSGVSMVSSGFSPPERAVASGRAPGHQTGYRRRCMRSEVVLIIEGVSAAAGNVGAAEHPGNKEIEVRIAVIRIVGAEETNL
jgi:hypothetical protein